VGIMKWVIATVLYWAREAPLYAPQKTSRKHGPTCWRSTVVPTRARGRVDEKPIVDTGTKGFQFSVGWELMVPSWSKMVSSQLKRHAQIWTRA